MIDALVTLAERLRDDGFDVSASELIDASTALCCIDIADRDLVREVLRSTMVKEADRDHRFDAAFDRVFRAVGRDERRAAAPGPASPGSAPGSMSTGSGLSIPRSGDLDPDILRALLEHDTGALVALAAQAVDAFSGIDGAAGTERYHMHRVLRAMDLSRMLSAAMQQLRRDGSVDDLELMVRRNEIVAGLEEFRRMLASEIASRVRDKVDDHGIDIPERTAPEDLDLLRLSRTDLEEDRKSTRLNSSH